MPYRRVRTQQAQQQTATSRSTGAAIVLRELTRTFRVPVRNAGLGAAFRSIFRREMHEVRAVHGISLDIPAGQVVGFLGPNGAGKTTALKMMAGILHPTAGEVRVLGYQPARRQREFLRQITMVMGNRNQLQWDLPAEDSFELQRAIYQIPWQDYRRTRNNLVDMLEVGEIVRKPIRNLSLGERMKVEFIGSLLHQPAVLFLDEPTIGFDVVTQRLIRRFIEDYHLSTGATILLTSHYMADIEALCERVVIIDGGQILLDDSLTNLGDRFVTHKEVEVIVTGAIDLSRYGEVIRNDGHRVRLRVPRQNITDTTTRLLATNQLTDLSISEPPIEDVIEMVYARGETR